MKNTTFQITLSSEQANLVVKALDFYTRMGIGQIQEIVNIARYGEIVKQDGSTPTIQDLDEAEDYIHRVKKHLTGFAPNASHSIPSQKVPAHFRTVYDIEAVLRQVLANHESPGGHSTWHGDPLHTNRDVPLAVVTIKEKESNTTGTSPVACS